MEVTQIFDCHVNERNEKHYVNVTNVRSSMKFEDYLITFKSNEVHPFLTKTMNHIVNANRKLIYAENESKFRTACNDAILALLTPIFRKLAVQEFFHKSCE